MARVKVCSVTGCQKPNDFRELFCTSCGSSLADATVRDENAPQASNEPPSTETRLEPAPGSFQATMEFTWGRADVATRLGIGRDAAFSTIAGKLSEFVSRRHAELFVEGDAVFVRHLGTTNPTYLNDRPLGTGEQARLGDGDVVSFSTQEKATVRIRPRQ